MFPAASFNSQRLRDLAIRISLFPEIVDKEMQDMAQELEQTLPDELGTVPSIPAVLPFEFASPKSKRYYFWAVRTGKIKTDGRRYIRSGKAAMGWKVRFEQEGNTYLIRISNDWKASIWVYGTLAAQGNDTRAAGHKRTGWELVKPKLDAKVKPLLTEIRKRLSTQWKEL